MISVTVTNSMGDEESLQKSEDETRIVQFKFVSFVLSTLSTWRYARSLWLRFLSVENPQTHPFSFLN